MGGLPRGSPAPAWRMVSVATTQGRVRFSFRATKVYYRGKFDKDGWVMSGGVAPLSWRFLVESVPE